MSKQADKKNSESTIIQDTKDALFKIATIAQQQSRAIKAHYVSQDEFKKAFSLGVKHGLDASLDIITEETGLKVENGDESARTGEPLTNIQYTASATIH